MSFIDFVSMVSFCISVIGVIVISWGVFLVVLDFLHGEFLRIFKKETKISRDSLRVKLGLYILLGLEFMIAGDIIHTVLKPSKDSLIILGSIVAIRTVISYFLLKELQGTTKK